MNESSDDATGNTGISAYKTELVLSVRQLSSLHYDCHAIEGQLHQNGTHMTENQSERTDFGFQQVPWQDKARRVRAVFDSVADRYDLMNDLMSGGAHRLWKQFTLSLTGLKAGPTGAGYRRRHRRSRRRTGAPGRPSGLVVLADINASMLQHGRDRLTDRARRRPTCSTCRRTPSDCHSPRRSFDCVTIGFGLRNVTDKAAALASMRRVLKPGGQLLVLEFSQPVHPGAGPRSTTLIPSICCRGSGARSPVTPTATAIWRNPSGVTRTRRHCSR